MERFKTRPVLSISGVSHHYGRVVALRQVGLAVAPGECVALLGPNGAGKTTLVNLVNGLLRRRSGTITVVGGDPARAATRRHLGVVQQSVGFPRTLTVAELVRGAAVRSGQPAAAAGPVLVETGLAELRRRRAARLSGGQQQRLQLAMALVGDPALLVLDEPQSGLDVSARRAFWRTLAGRRDQGAGVLLTTHQLEEAAAVADRVVVLADGCVVADGAPEELMGRLPTRSVSARTALAPDILEHLDGVVDVRVDGGRLRFSTTRAERAVRELLARDPELSDLRVEGASLEEAVLVLTGTGSTESVEVGA